MASPAADRMQPVRIHLVPGQPGAVQGCRQSAPEREAAFQPQGAGFPVLPAVHYMSQQAPQCLQMAHSSPAAVVDMKSAAGSQAQGLAAGCSFPPLGPAGTAAVPASAEQAQPALRTHRAATRPEALQIPDPVTVLG